MTVCGLDPTRTLMPNAMSHEEAAAKYMVEGYVLSDLTEEELERFEEHLLGCPRCIKEVCVATEVLRVMRRFFESQEGQPR